MTEWGGATNGEMTGTNSSAADAVCEPARYPLLTETVLIDDRCTGDRWVAQDESQLARLVAVIAMGQAAYAARILRDALPAHPAFTDDDLRREARIALTVQEPPGRPRTGYPRWHRDGFVFEGISWIAARQTHGENVLLKDPHVSATSQGVDGLMIKLADDKSRIVMTTIFEDKCTENPRGSFVDKVMPAFLDRHRNKRSAELVAAASVLLRMAGIDDAIAAQLAAAVMERSQRCYRAAFALTTESDSREERQKLFSGFDALDGISADQRIGASLIVDEGLRDWFDRLASQAVVYLAGLRAEGF